MACRGKFSRGPAPAPVDVEARVDGLTYEWNPPGPAALSALKVLDDTLRDGLQSPSARHPDPDEKLELLDLAAATGIDAAILGLPASGREAVRSIARLGAHAARHFPGLETLTAVRTLPEDVDAHRRACDGAGTAITAALFVGSSPIRAHVERWDLKGIVHAVETSVAACVRDRIPVLFVTEDTTRSHPDTIREIYRAAIGAGAGRVCISDTVGHAEPEGARRLVRFLAQVVAETGTGVGIDWHGHNDRGLSLINAVAAAEAGASRVHATCLGLGERTGNTALEQLLVHLMLAGVRSPDLMAVAAYAERVHRDCHAPLPENLPILGRDAFRTSSGIHAAAIYKALGMNETALADRVYSSVPASLLGRRQVIDIGPMSGVSNVQHWLDRHAPGLDPIARQRATEAILAQAKAAEKVLSDAEVYAVLARVCGPVRVRA